MARVATVDQADVFELADRLVSEGGRPTARGIRDRLGRGSMATILKHLQAWQAKQTVPAAATPVLPANVLRALADFVAAEVAQARAELAQALESALQGQKDLIAENEDLQANLDGLQQTLEQFQADYSQLEGRHAQIVQEFTEVKALLDRKRDEAAGARTEIATLTLKLEWASRLEADYTRCKDLLEQERVARATAEQAAAVAQARLEALRKN